MVELNGGGGGESSEPAGWPLSLTFQREKLHQMTHCAIDTLSRYLAFFKIRFLLNLQKGNKSMGFN
jgi:hypothetical protein